MRLASRLVGIIGCGRTLLPVVLVLAACIDSTLPTLPGDGGGQGALPGSVEITVSTTGVNPDPNGYQLVLNEATSQAVAANGTVTFGGLAPGSYQVTLFGLEGSCAVQGSGSSQSFTIASGATTTVGFEVDCP